MREIKIQIPENVLMVINQLNKQGYEAYIVGGCTRDAFIGRIPGDWDVTTSARPEEVKAIFDKTVDTGIKHGTVTVITDNSFIEVTTFRREGEYLDFRHPSSVTFTGSITEDLKRRDFTMNAIAYNPATGFVDPFDGISDISKGIIRCVGNADERFREDALRMIRAVRFACQLGFEIEEVSLKAVVTNSDLICKVSMERVRDELNKILLSDYIGKIEALYNTGLLSHIIPELAACFDTEQKNPYHIYNVGVHSVKAAGYVPKILELRWAMLLHDIGKPEAKTTGENSIDHFYGHPDISEAISRRILKRLKMDNTSIDKITRLIRYHDRPIACSPKSVRKAVSTIGGDIFTKLLEVKKADMRAQNPMFLAERLKELDCIRILYDEIVSLNQCISIDRLAVDGNDIKELGVAEGKKIGLILQELLEAVIENPELNIKDELLKLALNIKERFRQT